jgi:broad specificity phosphatase PhoE
VPTTILMVRHGETDWNRDNRFQGHADPPLNDVGRSQARRLAAQLAGRSFAAVYSSPLRRAYETALIVASVLDVTVQISDALREVDVGSWSGLTRAEVEARFPDGYRRWLDFGHGWDDGESYEELGRRVVEDLLRVASAHSGETVLVITHGGPIRSTLAAADGVPFDEARRSIDVVGNCAVVSLAIRHGALERLA